MKFKSLFFTAIASVAALLASCTPQEQLIEPKMATDRATYTIGAEGGDVTVKLLAGQDWTATVVPGTSLDEVSDVTVTPDQGVASSAAVEVKVTFGENSGFNRKARVSFQGKTLSAAVVIEQEGKDGERLLKCSVSEFLQKPVDASVYYELTGIVGTITNDLYSNFYIVDPETEESILIYGLAYKEDVTNQKVSLLAKEGVQEGDTITIASTRSDYNGTPQGKNSYYISHEKSQNPMIKLGISEIVAVAGGSFDLAVTSNKVTWTLTSDVEWLSFEPSTGSESTVVVVSVAEEKEGDVNEATITLSAEGLESVTCAVTRTNIQDATAAEVNAAEDGKVFRVTGIVSSIANEKYGNLYIKDYTGEVYVYGTNNFAEEGIAAGDVITVVGSKSSFNEAPQMKNVDVEKHYSIKDTPVADFRAAEDSKEVYYRLTGKVTRSEEANTKFDLETWGNFALADETGNVYVYGVVPAWGAATKQFGTLGVKEGDTITIIAYKTTFKETIEADGCVYISHEAADTPRPDAKIYINEVSTGEKKLELYNASEQEVSLKGYSLKQRNDATADYKNWDFTNLAEEVKIPAGGFVVVNCKQDTDATGPTFGLSGTKGFLLQLTFGEEVIDYVDNLTTITEVADSQSYGRKTDGSEEWVVFGTPSLGESNANGVVVVEALKNCGEINAAILAGETALNIKLDNPAEITLMGSDKKSVFVQDETGAVLIYSSDLYTMLSGAGAVAGYAIQGEFTATATVYNGLPEITAAEVGASNLTATNKFPCVNLTIAELLADFDKYLNCKVKVAGVTVSDGWSGSDKDGVIAQGETSIPLYVKNYSGSITVSVPTGSKGDFTGFVAYNKTTKQLTFWEDSGFVASELPGIITVNSSVSLEVGATVALAATVNSGAALSYASADETVATVSAEGVVTAVKEGTTTITVTAPATGIYTAATAEVAVTVTAAGAAVPTWTKVETVADLLAGGKAIIGYNSADGFIPMANFGSATSSATGYLYSGAAASAGDKTVLNMANPGETSNFEVTVEASTVVEGAVCIKAKEGYIGNENTKNNCKLYAEQAEHTSFVPTVEGGEFTLKLSNANYHTLQYNASSPRFAVYGGTQKNLVIYILK